MMRPTLVAILLGASAAACGEVKPLAGVDAGDEPDADGGTAIESTSPAADTVGVDVVTAVTLTFSGPIDPASIDGAIQVYERSSQREVPVATTAWDDATRTLTATLVRPLNYAYQYRVEVSGLTADSEPVTVPDFRFRTYANEYQRFRKWAGGIPTERADYTLDAEGFSGGVAGYLAGPDSAFDTADDVVQGWTSYEHAADGSYTTTLSYGAPGADAQWLTADDVINSHSVYDFGETDAGHHRIRWYAGAGADAQWRTADDVISYWQTFTYDAQDRLIRHVLYNVASNGLGPDDLPHTADDVPSSASTTSYPSATSVEQLNFNGPGGDGAWLTSDDAIASRAVTTLDDAGRVIAVRTFNAASVPLAHMVNQLDASGLRIRSVSFTGDGPDNTWFTADDDLAAIYSAMTYDAQHRRTRNSGFDLGANGVGPDADDREVQAYFMYDLTR